MQSAFNASATVVSEPESAIASEVETGMSVHKLAALSRPTGQAWKKRYMGKRGSKKGKRHERVNWMLPFLFRPIQAAADKHGYKSADAIVKACQDNDQEIYRHLHKGTLHKWLNKERKGWTAAVERKIINHGDLAGKGRAGILAKHPELLKEIQQTLLAIRESAISVNRMLACTTMIALIREHQPALLEDKFKCSEVKLPSHTVYDSDREHHLDICF